MEGGILSMRLRKDRGVYMELKEMCGVHCVKGILGGKEMWGKEMLKEVDHGHHNYEEVSTECDCGRNCGMAMPLGGPFGVQ
jgi:hypothetical protein